MYIAAGAALGSVHVGVGIEPQDPDLLAALAEEVRHAAGGPDGDRMIPAQRERQAAARERFTDGRGQSFAGGGDLRQILGMATPRGCGFRLRHFDIAEVVDVIAQRRDAAIQVGHTHG